MEKVLGGISWKGLVPVLVVLLTGPAAWASDTVERILFPAEVFDRAAGAPGTVLRTFSVPATEGRFTLTLDNGSPEGEDLVSAAVVKVNGLPVVRAGDLNQRVGHVDRPLGNLVKGANTLEVEVRSMPTSRVAVAVTGEYVLDVTIAEPAAGASIAAGRVDVQGTYAGYAPDVGITVNGVPAALSAGGFVASDVPLVKGANVLEARITTADGISDAHFVEVTATGEEPSLSLWVSVAAGVPPLEIQFLAESRGFEAAELQYDFDGDGSVDLSTASREAVAHTYASAGRFDAVVTAVGSGGEQATARRTVLLQTRDEADGVLRGRWAALSQSLQSRDVEAGVSSFLPDRQDKYRKLFGLLSSNLPAIFAGLPAPELLGVKGNVARYRVHREQVLDGVPRTIAHDVWFVRDADGLWRIDEL